MRHLLNWHGGSIMRPVTALVMTLTATGFLAMATATQSSAPAQKASTKQRIETHQSHRSVGKRAAPFEFITPARYKAQQGEIVTVIVDVRITSNVHAFAAEVRGEKGVAIVRAPVLSKRQSANLSPGDTVSLSFDVVAANEGLTYVNVLGKAQAPEGMRMSSYSVALEVGDMKRAAAAAKNVQKAGQRVIDDNGVALRVYPAAEAARAGEEIR